MENSLLIFFAVTFWFADARVISLREPRLSLVEETPNYYFRNYDGHSNTYMFGYDNDNQYRTEERLPNGTVVGSFGYIGPDGTPYKYNYIADEKGYRVMTDRSGQTNNMGQQSQNNMNQPNKWMQTGMNPNQNPQNNVNQIQNQQNWNQIQQNNNNKYQPNYNNPGQYQQTSNMYQNQNQYQETRPKATTEDSITWSRPKKQNNRNYYHNYVSSRQNSIEPSFSYVPMLRRSLR